MTESGQDEVLEFEAALTMKIVPTTEATARRPTSPHFMNAVFLLGYRLIGVAVVIGLNIGVVLAIYSCQNSFALAIFFRLAVFFIGFFLGFFFLFLFSCGVFS